MEIIKEDIQLTEWEAQLEDIILSLPTTKYHNVNADFYTACTKDFSLFAAIKLIDSFQEIVTTARYCLSRGCRFNHKVYLESNKDGVKKYDKQAQYVMNFHELKSAIVWYNSAMDYLLQVIYFGFGFHGEVNNTEDFYNELIKPRWGKCRFYEAFERLSLSNPNAKGLFEMYENTYKNSSVMNIRSLANNMKHHGGFDLEEYPKDSHHNIGCTDKYGNMVCYNEITQRPRVSYQKIVEHLIGAHKAIIELGNYIVEQLGLSEIEKPGYVLNMDNPQRLQKFIYKKDDV
ncbi:MAG: hypothetical protein IKL50_06165 [Bacteroidales bacterium]|nr:hypothetical protein [Bacteroidales bacterium]